MELSKLLLLWKSMRFRKRKIMLLPVQSERWKRIYGEKNSLVQHPAGFYGVSDSPVFRYILTFSQFQLVDWIAASIVAVAFFRGKCIHPRFARLQVLQTAGYGMSGAGTVQ
jgi:hypothetical protein